jgi:hypothetical protein
MCSTVAVVALAGAVVLAQGEGRGQGRGDGQGRGGGAPVTAPAKIATLADHAMLMKSNAQANGAIGKALASGAYADARTAVGTLRTNLMTLRTFWTEKKNVNGSAEALKVVNDGLMRADALDKMLAAPAPDQMAAQAAAKEMGGNVCGACHKMMREGDAQTGFRFREGMNPF